MYDALPSKKHLVKHDIKIVQKSPKKISYKYNGRVDLSYVMPVKSTVEILQNFVAFSENMNFNLLQPC